MSRTYCQVKKKLKKLSSIFISEINLHEFNEKAECFLFKLIFVVYSYVFQLISKVLKQWLINIGPFSSKEVISTLRHNKPSDTRIQYTFINLIRINFKKKLDRYISSIFKIFYRPSIVCVYAFYVICIKENRSRSNIREST